MIVIDLPTPPSANRIWRNGNGRTYRSPAYNAWTKTVGQELMVIRAKPIKGRVKIEIAVGEKSRADLDNHAKATVDSLVKFGIIEGDGKKIVRSVALKWDADVKGIRVSISPTL